MAHLLFNHMINVLESKLVSVETELDRNADYFNGWHTNDETDRLKVFCRKTQYTLRVMFWLIVSRIVHSLPVTLDSFFSVLGLPVPTKSGFSMKRKVIRSGFFRMMNQTMMADFYHGKSVKKWHDYVLLACDGSRIALPNVKELGEAFGYYHTYQGEELYPSGKACIFQDTLNNLTVCAELVGKDEDERHTFEAHYRSVATQIGSKTIFLLDRGYFSYNIMYLLDKDGYKFVMKARDTPWRRNFLKSGRKQQVISIKPSRATSIYSNKEWRRNPMKELTVRLVRFDHPNGSTDVLITNLTSEDGVTYKDVIELYRLRWPAETAYGIYKNDEALELFSSFRTDGVLQDFHAAVILFNLASLLARDGTEEGRGKVKPDMNVVIGFIHNLCPMLACDSSSHKLQIRLRNIVREVRHCTIQIREGRTYPRIRRLRKTSGKFYRHTNYSIAV